MTRADDIKTERRRRKSDSLTGRQRKLMVDEDKLDRNKFVYRFANDEESRLHNLTKLDDWDVVTDVEGESDQTGMGSEVSRHVGLGKSGKATRAVLLRKPKHLHDEDERAKQRRIDATEDGMREGATPGADNSSQYVPEGGISIRSGGKT